MNTTLNFKISFSKIIYLFAVAVFALCATGIALSVSQIAEFGIASFTDVLKYPFLIFVSVFCIAVVVALLIKSQYVVNQRYLIVQYGFIKSKFDLSSVTSMVLDLSTDKLTLYMGEEFIVLTTSKEWNEKFVRAILDRNPSAEYTFVFSDENSPEK